MDIGRARRCAALYSRWHKTPAYVIKTKAGDFNWTAPFKIDGTFVLPPKDKIVVTFVDGVTVAAALFSALGTAIGRGTGV